MRIALAALTLFTLTAAPAAAHADDDKPPPPHHHGTVWYAGWSMIATGGAATLVGAALTTRADSASSMTGWVLTGVGTAAWVGGAVVLRLRERAKR